MNIFKDQRVVLTLDAGGTNFVFNALKSGKQLTQEIRKSANANNLDLCITTIKEGFYEVMQAIQVKPIAISFAFPGPADYPNGIIGDLNNLPAFRGGIALKAILEEEFKIPVFINNDGDLYAYGEALGGILPEINAKLEEVGSPKRYKNLIGLTLGTGFGGGLVRNNELFIGDNSIASEVWLLSNKYGDNTNSEDVVSTRSVQRVYSEIVGLEYPNKLMPKDIFDIAMDQKEGDKLAARNSYYQTGKALGDTVANLFTLLDGIIVIGGGITGAHDLYMPAVMEELNSNFAPSDSGKLPRLVQKIFNLDDATDQLNFYKDYSTEIPVHGTNKRIKYDPIPRLAIATSRIGGSEAIALGAYAFALKNI